MEEKTIEYSIANKVKSIDKEITGLKYQVGKVGESLMEQDRDLGKAVQKWVEYVGESHEAGRDIDSNFFMEYQKDIVARGCVRLHTQKKGKELMLELKERLEFKNLMMSYGGLEEA